MEKDMERIRNFFKKDRFAAHNNVKLLEVRPGYARAEMKIEEHHLNGVNITHGGAIFTLADLVFAVACNSHGTVAVAVNVNISFLKATVKGSLLTAEGRELSLNPKLGTYQIDVRDQHGELIATFHGTAYRKKMPLE